MDIQLPSTQRAVVYKSQNKSAVIVDAPVSELADGHVLIQTAAVAVNPADWKWFTNFDIQKGAISGLDFAGTIISTGSGVKQSALGKRVCGMFYRPGLGSVNNGAFSEFVSAPAELVIELPDSMSFESAASLGTGISTAGLVLYQTLKLDWPKLTPEHSLGSLGGVPPKPHVLVFGASTATGTLIVQLLKHSYYQPIAVCSPHNFDLLRRCGAVACFDYRSRACSADIRELTRCGLGVAIDCISSQDSIKICHDSIGPSGGRYVSLDPFFELPAARSDVQNDWVLAYSISGKAITLPPPYTRPAAPEDRSFGVKWLRLVERLLKTEQLATHPIEIKSGGFLGIRDGIRMLRKGVVSGKKLVYQIPNRDPDLGTKQVQAYLETTIDSSKSPISLFSSNEAIAIVGSACRFPGGANSVSKFWDLIRNPRDVAQNLQNRMSMETFYHADKDHHGTMNLKQAYLLDGDQSCFDASFFSISPLEAEAMDPQQRLLLEVTFEAMEAAGIPMQKLRGSNTSVFVGMMSCDYADIQYRDIDTLPKYSATGSGRSLASNRLSYFYDWRGPSVTIDTACSSSLVAVHQAVQSLRSGESDVAVAAGSNLLLGPEIFVSESQLSMLSPDGRSKMWDASANGYARGEGTAVLFLKRLSQAIADNDHIECIIRETGVNQDGRTKGITVPSADAQANLIRQTYARAGLDPSSDRDRCQFFEAHGTGTPTGDPIEAKAIYNSFFAQNEASLTQRSQEKLLVGSVKTVIGHLEGCAGLAGLLRASCALRSGEIPPNLHFQRLNPKIKPFYSNLLVPVKLMPWPTVPKGSCRRASVNSFGFGGTNSHVILESFNQEDSEQPVKCSRLSQMKDTLQHSSWRLFPFSAQNELALLKSLQRIHYHLAAVSSSDFQDLAWTMQSRRTHLPVRKAIVANNLASLNTQLDNIIEGYQKTINIGQKARTLSHNRLPRILGIFTGQGAQWARMGWELLQNCTVFRKSFDKMQHALDLCPDPPDWTLIEELERNAATTRVYESRYGQPLNTAIQVALVELLAGLDIQLTAIVGHSSGEIAAAYAAGFISSSNAIRVAYYRGIYTELAQGTGGKPGSMAVAGISYDDALEFCAKPEFAKRIGVAANNGPSLVTLSGDEDAVAEALQHFKSLNIFAKKLQIERAYHSHHMQPCCESYQEAFERCNIQVLNSQAKAIWYSSTYPGQAMTVENMRALQGQYWIENMVSTVHYAPAIEKAMEAGSPFDLVLEIGPHSALKAPTLELLNEMSSFNPPYHGLLERFKNDTTQFLDTIGSIWASFSAPCFDFEAVSNIFESEDLKPKTLVRGLPIYPWDRNQRYWKESRSSANHRLQPRPQHELLGKRCPDDGKDVMRWSNILLLKELPWLRGHVYQSQVLVPGAGFVSMALESCRALVDITSVSMIELSNFEVPRALYLLENSVGVEINISLQQTSITSSKTTNMICAHFIVLSADEEHRTMIKNASCDVKLTISDLGEDVLPSRSREYSNLKAVDVTKYYQACATIGLQYQHHFKRMTSLKRELNRATATATWLGEDGLSTDLIVHPAVLDFGFASMFGAAYSISEPKIWSPSLPTDIKSIKVDVKSCLARKSSILQAGVDSYVTSEANAKGGLTGDISLFDLETEHVFLQVEGFNSTGMKRRTKLDDRDMFAEKVWLTDISEGIHEESEPLHLQSDKDLIEHIEKVCMFYYQRLDQSLTASEISELSPEFQRLAAFARAYLGNTSTITNNLERTSGYFDPVSASGTNCTRFEDSIDLRLVHKLGENLLPVIRGEMSPRELMSENELLEEFHVSGVGSEHTYLNFIHVMQQISHRYPQMKILEVGGSTAAATKSILEGLKDNFSSYTFTNPSSDIFEVVQEHLKDFSSKLRFQTLDIDEIPSEQGYREHSYDLIVAFNILHRTRNLRKAMAKIRKLLKPGGYILIFEPTGRLLKIPFLMSVLPGWFYAEEDSRYLKPTLSAVEWDAILLDSKFSGVDLHIPDYHDPRYHTGSIMLSQAVNEHVTVLREPLHSKPTLIELTQVLIIGGETLVTSKLSRQVQKLLHQSQVCIKTLSSVEQVTTLQLNSRTVVLCLTEIDQPLFSAMTPERMSSIRYIYQNANALIWITSGCRWRVPECNMSIGLGRSLRWEYPNVRVQFIDLEDGLSAHHSSFIASQVIRIAMQENISKTDMLWSFEPELILQKDRLLIGRVIPDRDLNEKLNSNYRQIVRAVNVNKSQVEMICQTDSTLAFQESGIVIGEQLPIDQLELRSSYTKLTPLAVNPGFNLYLNWGSQISGSEFSLALSSKIASTVQTPRILCTKLDIADVDVPEALTRIHAYIMARCLLQDCTSGMHLLFFEPDPLVFELAVTLGHEKGMNVTCITTKFTPELLKGVITVNQNSTSRQISNAMPSVIDMMIYFHSASVNEGFFSKIKACLPQSCVLHDANSSIFTNAFADDKNCVAWLATALEAAATMLNTLPLPKQRPGVVDPATITKIQGNQEKGWILKWKSSETIETNIRPARNMINFVGDRTYLLVGLTSDLGQSICQWLISAGVRYIALTSRNPQVDAAWCKKMQKLGGTVKIFKMDVTDKVSVVSAVQAITSEMPPIRGVCNGAACIDDATFEKMTFESLMSVIDPKVRGTKNLDEVFHDIDLDFFILFSSLSAVVGNVSQSNYGAANMFMASVAAQRRKRGLAASVMNAGMVVDVGYVSRQGKGLEEYLKRLRYLPITETDLHEMFAEAIILGRNTSQHQPEFTVGLQRTSSSDEVADRPQHFNNPEFSHWLRDDLVDEIAGVSRNCAKISEQLALAQNATAMLELLVSTVATMAEMMLSLPRKSIDTNAPLVDCGIDSLFAVEFRSWLLQELSFEVKITDLLGGISVTTLSEKCLQSLDIKASSNGVQ